MQLFVSEAKPGCLARGAERRDDRSGLYFGHLAQCLLGIQQTCIRKGRMAFECVEQAGFIPINANE